MKCHLYLQADGAPPRSLGYFEVSGEVQARKAADAQLRRRPDAHAVDIWWDSGELIRIERSALERAAPPPGADGERPGARA
jgi:hypothetical protein